MARTENGKPAKPSFVNFAVWMKYSANERDIICDLSEADYKAMLAEQANGDGEKKTVAAAPVDTHEPPKDVAEWAQGIASKFDDAFRADIIAGIRLKKDTVHKVLDYVGHIERLKLALPRWGSTKPKDSNLPDEAFDTYQEQRHNKKGKLLDPVTRHRIDDVFNAAFPALFNAVKTLQDMGDDAVKAMGENTYDEKLADAKFELNTGRNYFSDAAEVHSIWKAVNGVPGVRVAPHTKGDGSIEHKPFPWRLQDVILNSDGTVKDVRDGCNISTRDLQGYRPEVVNDMMQQKDEKGAPKYASTYQALLNSQKPRKPRKTGGATGVAGGTKAAQTAVRNINDYESAAADEAGLIETPGFKAEWLKLVNDPDQSTADAFLLTEWNKYKFLDRMFSMDANALATRAGKLADAASEKAKAEQKAKADKAA